MARVIKQECPRARWVRLLIGWFFLCSEILANPKLLLLDLSLLIKKLAEVAGKFLPISCLSTSKRFAACVQEDKYCFSHRFFHPRVESTLVLRRLAVTDVFARGFMRTEMNSDMELNQISVDIVMLTQDVSMSPISLALFIRFHKNTTIHHD